MLSGYAITSYPPAFIPTCWGFYSTSYRKYFALSPFIIYLSIFLRRIYANLLKRVYYFDYFTIATDSSWAPWPPCDLIIQGACIKKKGNRTWITRRMNNWFSYSERFKLLAIEWHAFHTKWRKNKRVRGRSKMLVKISYFHLCA
jgi:hypothetical protein